MARDPVSWLLAERGWKVVDAGGEKVGTIDEVLGDQQSGIFHGLIVNGEEILAERVEGIYEGEVRLL
jgi:hypothetical protein